jgi:hypothetical protein
VDHEARQGVATTQVKGNLQAVMRKLYVYRTRVGPFYIAEHNGRFHPVFADESHGSYATPQKAAEDLAGGHTSTPAAGHDPSKLGIPNDLSEWEHLF